MRPNRNGLDTPAKKSAQTVNSNPTLEKRKITFMHATPSIPESAGPVIFGGETLHTVPELHPAAPRNVQN